MFILVDSRKVTDRLMKTSLNLPRAETKKGVVGGTQEHSSHLKVKPALQFADNSQCKKV